MAYKGGGTTAESAAQGRAGGGYGGGKSGSAGGGSGKDKLDKKTLDALKEAFGPTGQATRQQDTTANNRASESYSGDKKQVDKTPNDLPPGANPLTQTANPTPSYEMTAENIGKIIAKGIPGPGSVAGAIADIAAEAGLDPLGLGGFDNPTGQTSTAERIDHAPGADQHGGVGQPAQSTDILSEKDKAPPATPVKLPDIWEYPQEADKAASVDPDGLTDEERRRRGNTSIVVLGAGGLAI
jgi:hypothetical protein